MMPYAGKGIKSATYANGLPGFLVRVSITRATESRALKRAVVVNGVG
jgi:hypothetical protein